MERAKSQAIFDQANEKEKKRFIRNSIARANTITFNFTQDKLETYSIIDLGKTAFKWDREKRKLVPKTKAEKEADEYN